MDPSNSETITSLQDHVNHLTGLLERISTLRKIPGLLLAPSTLTGTQLEQGFKQVNELKDVIGSNTTQDSLKLAQESISKNTDNVSVEARRESRKRRRPSTPTPESPRPLPSLPHKTFPHSSRESPMTIEDISSYIRSHNSTDSPVKLYIWTPTPRERTPQNVTAPWLLNAEEFIVRASITDVMYLYIRLAVGQPPPSYPSRTSEEASYQRRLVIESVSVFGLHERKSPHSQSDFTVFQKLSQHITWMIQTEPDVQLDSFMALLAAYETLFVSQCAICHRLLSEEGHVPPVCRLWIPYRKGKDGTWNKETTGTDDWHGRWEPRHRTCFTP